MTPGRYDGKRYGLAALVEACGLSEAALGRLVGLSGTSLVRAREWGLVEKAADRYACRAGMVPWLVWSDWLDDLKVECAERTCVRLFVPSRKGHIFCRVQCCRLNTCRNWANRKYASDPEYRAAKLAKNRVYHGEAKRSQKVKRLAREAADPAAVKARRRRYYLANRDAELERSRLRRERMKVAA